MSSKNIHIDQASFRISHRYMGKVGLDNIGHIPSDMEGLVRGQIKSGHLTPVTLAEGRISPLEFWYGPYKVRLDLEDWKEAQREAKEREEKRRKEAYTQGRREHQREIANSGVLTTFSGLLKESLTNGYAIGDLVGSELRIYGLGQPLRLECKRLKLHGAKASIVEVRSLSPFADFCSPGDPMDFGEFQLRLSNGESIELYLEEPLPIPLQPGDEVIYLRSKLVTLYIGKLQANGLLQHIDSEGFVKLLWGYSRR